MTIFGFGGLALFGAWLIKLSYKQPMGLLPWIMLGTWAVWWGLYWLSWNGVRSKTTTTLRVPFWPVFILIVFILLLGGTLGYMILHDPNLHIR